MGVAGAGGRPRDRVAGDAAWRSRPARAHSGWCGSCARGGPTCSTATWSMPTSWPARVRLFAPVPASVSTIHNIYEGGRLRMLGYRLTNGLVDHMTIISQAAADRFVRERHRARRTCSRSCPTAWTPSASSRCRPEPARDCGSASALGAEFAWLAVGRFEAAKDYPNMLRAFARVRERASEGGAAAGGTRLAAGGDGGARRRRWDWAIRSGSSGVRERRAGVHDARPTATSCPPPGRGCRWCCSRPPPPACPSWLPGWGERGGGAGRRDRVSGAAAATIEALGAAMLRLMDAARDRAPGHG